jgi:hypothetical protein
MMSSGILEGTLDIGKESSLNSLDSVLDASTLEASVI